MKKKILGTIFFVVAIAALAFAATHTSNTIATARAKMQTAKLVAEQGNRLGLNCLGTTEQCAEMIARADKNPQLKNAFLKIKAEGINILPDDWTFLGFSTGRVGEGYISINTGASDKKIIAFLTN